MSDVAICLDLDGTITAAELLPRIARELDLYDEIAILTQATIQGAIPFEKSFRLRCRLLRDVPIARVREIVAQVPLQYDVVEFVNTHPDHCFVVTGNLDVWIEPLRDQIRCPFYTSRARLTANRELDGVQDILNKGDAVRDLAHRFEQVVAVGEGMNDTPMFEAADVRVAHGAIHAPSQSVWQLADFVTVSGGGLCQLLASLL
ncbi:MAG: HAD family phosphatase [Planctomycetota bacterium]